MPLTVTQEVFEIRSIKPVHINPSIMEGNNLVSSLYGPLSAKTLTRFSPSNLVAPSVSGAVKIPSTITCNPGVWSSSPSPTFVFAWYVDGVLVESGPSNLFLTDETMDQKEVTCTVTATNTVGFVTIGSSNGVTVSIIETMNVMENSYYTVAGLPSEDALQMYFTRNYVITGLWVQDMITTSLYTPIVVSGMWVEDRLDFELFNMNAITGLPIEEANLISIYEMYSITSLTFERALDVVNPGGDSGSTTGWTNILGTPGVRTTNPSPKNGSHYFYGGATEFAHMQQTVAIPVDLETSVDTEILYVDRSFYCNTFSNNTGLDDRGKVYLEFFDVSMVSLGIVFNSQPNPKEQWDHIYDYPVQVPNGTRFIRIHVYFTRESGTNNDGYIDSISVNLWKNL